jgi:hypothetical protein
MFATMARWSVVRRVLRASICDLVVWHGISVTYSTGGSGSEGAIGVIVAGDPLEQRVQIVLGELPFERRGDLFVVLLEVVQA